MFRCEKTRKLSAAACHYGKVLWAIQPMATRRSVGKNNVVMPAQLSLDAEPSGQSGTGKAELTTFLLVEDDPNDVLFMQQAFNQAPACIRLEAVSDGLHAMHYLEGLGPYANRRTYPLPNVILLDLKMPRVDGFGFLEWLRAKAPREHRLIPVLVMSSSALPEDVQRAYSLGVNSYLVKPVDWYEFKERIKAIGIYWGEHVKKPDVRSG